MAIQKLRLKEAYNYLSISISILQEQGQDTRTLEVYRDDLEERIESKSISVFSKLKKLSKRDEEITDRMMMYEDGYPFSTLINFFDFEVNLIEGLTGKEELDILTEFVERLKEKELC